MIKIQQAPAARRLYVRPRQNFYERSDLHFSIKELSETFSNLRGSGLGQRFSGQYALKKARIEADAKIRSDEINADAKVRSDKIAAAQRIAESTNDNELKQLIAEQIFTL